MPSNPTTKSQVHAYKFVLRRMQSALVRKDAVMLHDPMRTHSRATIVGVVLTALAMLGFVIFGFFKPAPAPPGPGAIVIGEPSGQMYITTGEPMTLVPTFNLASARLLLMAQQNRGRQGAPAAGSAGAVEVKQPEVIPDDQLVDIPRGQPTGIALGPPLLPTKQQRISPHWAVCERVRLDPDLPDNEARDRATTKTTVVAGVSDLGRELRGDEALLVKAPQGTTYLVYRLDENPNRPNADVVRAEVDLNNLAVKAAYGLTERPRKVSVELLNSIPEADPIVPPTIKGKGTSKWGLDVAVGEVFYVSEASGRQYYVLTTGGKQEISKAVANLIRSQRTTADSDSIPTEPPGAVVDVPSVQRGNQAYLDVAEYPETEPTILNPTSVPTACLGWNITGKEPNREGHTTVYVSRSSPVPVSDKGESEAVDITQASPDGYQVDAFYLPPGRAAVVRSVTSKEQFGKGPSLQLVSSLGVRYGVPDAYTAKILGLTPQQPAPELILRLLPTGSSLNMQNAQQTWPATALARMTGTSQ